jgi:hypothetical protein
VFEPRRGSRVWHLFAVLHRRNAKQQKHCPGRGGIQWHQSGACFVGVAKRSGGGESSPGTKRLCFAIRGRWSWWHFTNSNGRSTSFGGTARRSHRAGTVPGDRSVGRGNDGGPTPTQVERTIAARTCHCAVQFRHSVLRGHGWSCEKYEKSSALVGIGQFVRACHRPIQLGVDVFKWVGGAFAVVHDIPVVFQFGVRKRARTCRTHVSVGGREKIASGRAPNETNGTRTQSKLWWVCALLLL